MKRLIRQQVMRLHTMLIHETGGRDCLQDEGLIQLAIGLEACQISLRWCQVPVLPGNVTSQCSAIMRPCRFGICNKR